MEHHNIATERLVKMLLVSSTSPVGLEKNEVIMIGCANKSFHGWWGWYDYNGELSLGIQFNSKDSNTPGWVHIFKAKLQPEEMLMPKEMYLLKGVNCPEAIVLCEQPPNSEVVTAATAEEFYNSIASQAVQYTPEDSDVCFSKELFSGRSEGD